MLLNQPIHPKPQHLTPNPSTHPPIIVSVTYRTRLDPQEAIVGPRCRHAEQAVSRPETDVENHRAGCCRSLFRCLSRKNVVKVPSNSMGKSSIIVSDAMKNRRLTDFSRFFSDRVGLWFHTLLSRHPITRVRRLLKR